jgi:hypothetical protein
MTTVNVAQALKALEALAAAPPPDQKLRKQLYNAAQTLSLAVESPYDTIYRVIYSVSSANRSKDNFQKSLSDLAKQLADCLDCRTYSE